MSGGGMPELGSKISLISKADIRYEGRLYTVDPQECTIALSNVRSFGTEDRETQFQIAPQSQIYDYILFRGSDIKDIRVINNSLPHHNDPAIMQVQMQNGGQHMMQPFPMQNMNAPPAPSMGAGGYGGPFGQIGSLGSGLGGSGSSGGAGASGMGMGAGVPGPFMLGPGGNQGPQQQQQQSKPQQQQQQQKSGGNVMAPPSSNISNSQQPQQPQQQVQMQQQQLPHSQQQKQQQQQQQHQEPPRPQQQLQQDKAQQIDQSPQQQQTQQKCSQDLLTSVFPQKAQQSCMGTSASGTSNINKIRCNMVSIRQRNETNVIVGNENSSGPGAVTENASGSGRATGSLCIDTIAHHLSQVLGGACQSGNGGNSTGGGAVGYAGVVGSGIVCGGAGSNSIGDRAIISGVIGGGLVSGGLGGIIHPASAAQSASVNCANATTLNEHKDQDMLGGGSRSTTPMSLISRKSPSDLMGFQQQLNQQNQQHMQQQQSHHMNQQQHHQLNQNNLMSGSGHHNNGGNAQRDAGQHKRQNHQQQRGGGIGGQQLQQHRERRDSGRNTDNYNNQRHHDGRNNYNNNNHPRNNMGITGNGPNNMNHRNWNMHRGGPTNASSMMRSRNGTAIGGGRGRIQNHQGYRPIGGIGGNKPRNQKTTIKFEQDFDFEQANNKFEELRSQFNKLKVGEEQKSTEQINGETDKKEDSGNETGAGDHEHEEDDIVVGYDKAKSFFDNISCEAAQDRTKNKKNDWRQERKLNSETFGVSSTRRGSYRGRNNYYNRNIGGGMGYNRAYRGGGTNYRNRSNNRTSNGRENNLNSNASNKVNSASSSIGNGNGSGTVSGTGTTGSNGNAANNVTGTPKTTQPQAQGSQTPQTTATPNAATRSTPAAPGSASTNTTSSSSNVTNTTPSQPAVAVGGAGQ